MALVADSAAGGTDVGGGSCVCANAGLLNNERPTMTNGIGFIVFSPIESLMDLHVRALLLLKPPAAVPIFAGRMQDQFIKPIDKGHRWAIVGGDSERRLKPATRFVPLSAPVARQCFRETIAQLELRRR